MVCLGSTLRIDLSACWAVSGHSAIVRAVSDVRVKPEHDGERAESPRMENRGDFAQSREFDQSLAKRRHVAYLWVEKPRRMSSSVGFPLGKPDGGTDVW
jgi:hypothetical protein